MAFVIVLFFQFLPHYAFVLIHIIIKNKDKIYTDKSSFFLFLFKFKKMSSKEGFSNEAFESDYSIKGPDITSQTNSSAPEMKKSEFCFEDSEQHQQQKCTNFSKPILKRKILKNVLLISMAFMVLFTSFQSMASLQSSINKARSNCIVNNFKLFCNYC